MRRFVHGGDTYGLPDVLDFSASLNPLGMPEGVRRAILDSVDACRAYPDPQCRKLTAAIAQAENLPASQVLPCAGATDALARVCLALKPKRALVCDPCYSGYEQALALVGAQVARHRLREEDDFAPDGSLADSLVEADAGLVFLANPNNPTGVPLPRAVLERVLRHAGKHGATVVLDESFIGFTGEPSACGLLATNPHLVVVKSFTKLYAMPGVRAGYLLCADGARMAAFEAAGQPWAVSTPAQAAGVAALSEAGFVERTREFVAGQRAWLMGELGSLGLRVVPGQANYLLFCSDAPLSDVLLERGIVVRGCEDFPGLSACWHRVAVRAEVENRLLIAALKGVLPA